ncbi:MAG: ABC transporter permease [Chloroflexi bacterium]|nr:ABC transporter permease [Chloroflexota bacterium]
MRDIGLVIKHEIKVTLSKRTYWIMTFLLPAFILAGTLLPQIIAGDKLTQDPLTAAQTSVQHIGVVDAPGVIKQMPPGLPPQLIRLYNDKGAAQAALAAGLIDQVLLIPDDFLDTGKVTAISKGNNMFSSIGSENLLTYIIAYNLTDDPLMAAILVDPLPQVETTALAAPPSTDHGDNPAASFVPFMMMFVLFFVISITAGYMLQSVAKEKENRTVEVLLLSLQPRQLMLGKVLGLGIVALVQMLVWMLGARTALQQGAGLLSLPPDMTLSFSYLAVVLVFFILGYFLYASLLGAVGALAPNVREGTQFTFMLIFPLILPFWVNSTFVSAPHGPLTLFLSLFPLTAPTAMVARLAVGSVPGWQLGLSLLGLLAATYAFVSLAARFFRADVLLSSSSLNWRRIWQELRTTAVEKA